MKRNTFFTAKNVTSLAVLLALVIVLQAVGGSFSIGPVSLNFTLIPIVLGAILLGPIAGALLGFACGVVVLVQVILGLVPFYVLIWTETPVAAALTCLVKTTVAGWVAGWLFRYLAPKNRYLAIFAAAGIVPLLNTALFVVGCLFMWDAILTIAGGTNVFAFILVSLVTFNFFAELAVNLLVAPALHTIYKALEKQFKK